MPMSTIQNLVSRVNDLNKRAAAINYRLFVFDEFCPKEIPVAANDEVRFWYLITNIYGLFFDCGKYIKKLDIAQYDIVNFYNALNEIRSIWSHNKTVDSYLIYKIANFKLNNLVSDWGQKFIYNSTGLPQFPRVCWGELYQLFEDGSNAVLDIIEKKLLKRFETDKANNSPTLANDLYDNWFKHIIDWYLNADEVYLRAVNCYVRINSHVLHIAPTNVEQTLAFKLRQQRRDLRNYAKNINGHSAKEQIIQELYKLLKDPLTPRSLLMPFLDNVFQSKLLPSGISKYFPPPAQSGGNSGS